MKKTTSNENKAMPGVSINREFIPIFLVIATPLLGFMNGFGVITISTGFDVYYLAAMAFGLFMCYREKIRFTMIYELVLLFLLEIAINLPYMKQENFFNGNYLYLCISYGMIVIFFLMVSISFWINNPYYLDYYSSGNYAYRLAYKITGAFFMGIAVFHIYLFTRIIEILKYTFR